MTRYLRGTIHYKKCILDICCLWLCQIKDLCVCLVDIFVQFCFVIFQQVQQILQQPTRQVDQYHLHTHTRLAFVLGVQRFGSAL